MATRGKQIDVDRKFAEGFREARIARGLTQDQVTTHMSERGFDFYQATVYKIENHKRRVTIAEALALAEIVGVPVTTLAGDRGHQSIELNDAMRFERFAETVFAALQPLAPRWPDDFGRLVLSLGNALDDSGDNHPSDLACWLGSWVRRGLALHEAFFSTFQAATDISQVANTAGARGAVENIVMMATGLLADARWANVPASKSADALDRLEASELYYTFLSRKHPFEADDGEHQAEG